jgi:hypothetical protein
MSDFMKIYSAILELLHAYKWTEKASLIGTARMRKLIKIKPLILSALLP